MCHRILTQYAGDNHHWDISIDKHFSITLYKSSTEVYFTLRKSFWLNFISFIGPINAQLFILFINLIIHTFQQNLIIRT